jgi:hypothetical protein
VLACAVLSFDHAAKASVGAYVFIAATTVFLFAYNFFRIRSARRALAAPGRLPEFARAQRKSHLVRGRIYLVAAPIIVVVTWLLLARDLPSVPPSHVIVAAAGTVFLGFYWLVWLRTIRRIRRDPS